MKKLFFIILFLMPLLSMAQGIKFEEGLTWEQVVAKATAENKMIFVDCYATWCKPCKEMDKNVYPNDTVGQYMNDKFISVKIQMDTSNNDGETIKILYSTARQFENEYEINSLPTYLFFSFNGSPLHKASGTYRVKEFVKLVNDSENPVKQFYTVVNNWKNGKYSLQDLPELSLRFLREFNSMDYCFKVGREYMLKYLNTLTDYDLMTKANIKFLYDYNQIINTNDKLFSFIYKRREEINELMQDESGRQLVHSILLREAGSSSLYSLIQSESSPNWEKITAFIDSLTDKYYAKWVVFSLKSSWFGKNKDFKNEIKYLVKDIDMRDLLAIHSKSVLNSLAWKVFQYSNVKKELKKALSWSNRALTIDTKDPPSNSTISFLDTKANILYKLGKVKEAILIESKIISDYPKAKYLEKTLEKMKHGEKTWLTNLDGKNKIL